MEAQRNIEYLFIAKDIARAASAGTTIDAYSDLSDGEVVWVNPYNVVVDTGTSQDCADYDKLRLVQRSGTSLLFSPWIKAHSVKSYNIDAYTAATEQIDYIGYNTSSGSMEVTDNTLYLLRLFINNHRRRIVKYGVYKSGASTTQNKVADGIASSLISHLLVEKKAGGDDMIKVDRVTGSSTTSSTSGNFTVVHGSNVVSAATDVDNGGMVVGDYLVLSDGTTASAYKVTAIDTVNNTATLDVPYQGASGTVTDGNSSFITATNARAGNWGIKLTGVAQTYTAGRSQYTPNGKISWNYELQGFGSDTTETASQAMTFGTGTYAQIAEMEEFLQGNEGSPFRNSLWGPAPSRRTDALSSETYDVMRLEFLDEMQSNLGPVNNSPIRVAVAIAVDAAQGDDADTGIGIVADDWLVTSHMVPGLTAQSSALN